VTKTLHAQYKKSGDIQIFLEFLWELTRHAIGEEVLVYPLLETLGDSTVAQLKGEHKEVAELAEKMNSLSHPSPEFDAAFDDLFLHLGDHITKEESADIPFLVSKLSEEERLALGKQFMGRKKIEATRSQAAENPHHTAIKEACTLLLGPVDKFRDLFKPEEPMQKTDAQEEPEATSATDQEEEASDEPAESDSVSAAAGKRPHTGEKRPYSPDTSSGASSTSAPKKGKAKKASKKSSKTSSKNAAEEVSQ